LLIRRASRLFSHAKRHNDKGCNRYTHAVARAGSECPDGSHGHHTSQSEQQRCGTMIQALWRKGESWKKLQQNQAELTK
jgi:hypothetical protein